MLPEDIMCGDVLPNSFIEYNGKWLLYGRLERLNVESDRIRAMHQSKYEFCPSCCGPAYNGVFEALVVYMYCPDCKIVWYNSSVKCLICSDSPVKVQGYGKYLCDKCGTLWDYDVLREAYLLGDTELKPEDL